jgi:uncharacterized protein
MSKFHPLSEYGQGITSGYKLLPLRFSPLDPSRYVLTNFVGEHHVLQRDDVYKLIQHKLSHDEPAYNDLKSKHFLVDSDSNVAIDLLALKTHTKYERISNFTSLHLFVVTLRCEHSCPYCQVSRQNDDKRDFDMTPAIADKSLDLAFRSPSPSIKIEFQGGEPMLNFPIIEYIVKGALARNETAKRNLGFVIATNLAVVTDAILEFCEKYSVEISTSLDGPADLHNKNRPRAGGDSYEKTIEGIAKVRNVLGFDKVSAMMTTTAASLSRPKDIVDEYIANGFRGIFLRPLSPYGFAIKTKSYKAYDSEKWLPFYFEGLDYIIELNRSGHQFNEVYASIILQKILTPFQTSYVDLISPAGIGLGALVYNYDGKIYASDESRMLAEMHDDTFCLGTVADSYETLMLSDKLLDPLEQSFAASAPMCSTCAYEPYCGADPVYHHATQGDFVGRKPNSDFCRRNMSIFQGLITRMEEDDFVRDLFTKWANR